MANNTFNLQSVLLKWVPTVLVGFIATYWTMAGGKAKEAGIAFGATVLYPLVASLLEGFVKGAKKRADEKGQAYGEAFVDFVIVDLPKKIGWRLSRFEKQYRKSVIDYYCKLKIEGFKIGLPVLNLEDVFVDLRLAPGIPQNAERNILPNRADSTKENREIWDFLPQSYQVAGYLNLAILAPPGYGKTTLLQYLTLIYSKKLYGRRNVVYLTPVLLFLRDWREEIIQDNPPCLPEIIVKAVREKPAFEELKPPPQWFEKRLRAGRCLVMLDGLDEVANEGQRIKVSQWINDQMNRYKSAVFILTSRPYGYDSNLFEKVDNVLEVKSFDLEGIKRFINQWYKQTEIRMQGEDDNPAVIAEARTNAEDLIERIVKNPSLRTLAKNPLLVTMIATVHYTGSALPRRRVELYDKICDVLLGDRLTAKKLKSGMAVEQRKSVLQVLALKLIEKETRTFSEAEGVELIRHQLAVVDNSLKPEVFLEWTKDVCGLAA